MQVQGWADSIAKQKRALAEGPAPELAQRVAALAGSRLDDAAQIANHRERMQAYRAVRREVTQAVMLEARERQWQGGAAADHDGMVIEAQARTRRFCWLRTLAPSGCSGLDALHSAVVQSTKLSTVT
jgi:hypothetical protein